MRIIFHLIVSTVAVLVAAYLLPGVTTTLTGAFVFAIVLAIINLFLRPIIRLLTLPLTILTLGLFSLVVNALLVLLAAAIVPGIEVVGFWSALLFAILLSLINTVFHHVGR